MIMRIETTPEMRRFNKAVERSDRLLGDGSDRLDVPALITALTSPHWEKSSDMMRAAHELRESAKAISPAIKRGE